MTKGARRQEVNVVYTKEREDLNHFSGLSANASQQDLNPRGARTSIGSWAQDKGYVYTLLSRGKNRTSGNQGSITQVRFAKTACFVAGTKVWLHDYSTIKIENIRPGMLVRSKDVKSNREVIGQVDHIITKKASTLIEIYTPLDTFLVTPEHPFYIDGAWVTAGKLKKGQTLTLLDQPRLFASNSYDLSHPQKTYIDHIVVKDTAVTVYNFSVTKYHNYYVGNVGTLVHNNCDNRAKEIAEAIVTNRKGKSLPPWVKRSQLTVAVLDVVDGSGNQKRLVSVNKSGALLQIDDSVPDQIKRMLKSNEEYIDPFNYLPSNSKAHAEAILIEYAKQKGYNLKGQFIGASKDICPDCEAIIKKEGIINQTPFRGN